MTEAEKPMLGPSNRLADYAPEPNLETKKKDVVWFAIDDNRPLTCFAVLSSRAIVTQNRSLLVEQGRRAQAEAVRAVIDGLTKEKAARFWQFDGAEAAW